MGRDLRLIAYSFVIESEYTTHWVGWVHAGRQIDTAASTRDPRGDPPWTATLTLDLRIGSRAQAAARCKKRHGFKQIGFPCPVFAGQDGKAAMRRPGQTLIITKIREDEPGYTQRSDVTPRQTRIGMRT